MRLLRPRFQALLVLLSFAMLASLGTVAQAQINPNWDHYKAYDVNPKFTLGAPVTLIDQFTTSNHVVQYLDWFANPVQKDHNGQVFPIHNPELHYTWWKIDEQPFDAYVLAINQFGSQSIHILKSSYLLNPALKNQPPGMPLPQANHYKCYTCEGNPINVPVNLSDQFYMRSAFVMYPRFFCNPVEKRLQSTGQVYPIIDPLQHYVIYEIDPGPPVWQANIQDQFLPNDPSVQLTNDRWLLVPTDKQGVTKTTTPTWGRLKTLYR